MAKALVGAIYFLLNFVTLAFSAELSTSAFSVTYGCGGDSDKGRMVRQLFTDKDFVRFSCAEHNCKEQVFRSRVEFKKYGIDNKPALDVCIVESKLKGVNYYSGVFAKYSDRYLFQFTSLTSGITLGRDANGVPTLTEAERGDSSGQQVEITSYRWNGRYFTYVKSEIFPLLSPGESSGDTQ